MLSRKSMLFLLALAACENPQPEQTATSNEVLGLARDAVASSAPAPVAPAAPIDDRSLIGTALLTDPVAPVAEPASSPVPEVAMTTFTLRNGETLDHFARWSGYTVEDIAAFSGLSLDGSYAVGTEIRLPVEGDAVAAIDLARAEHWSRRLDGYLASRGGAVGTEFYQVRTGDSAWSIARHQYAIPMWVLEMYNPSVDLDGLRPGQELMLPVLADIVVDAAPSEIPEMVAPETGEPESVEPTLVPAE